MAVERVFAETGFRSWRITLRSSALRLLLFWDLEEHPTLCLLVEAVVIGGWFGGPTIDAPPAFAARIRATLAWHDFILGRCGW